jgi:hypothetical protein
MSYCKACEKLLERKPHESPKHLTDRQFCNRSCAAKYNNTGRISPLRNPDRVCRCGGRKDHRASSCRGCKHISTLSQVMRKPLNALVREGDTRTKYNEVRHWARRAMELWGVEKKCSICDFDIVVEVCHVRALRYFATSDLISMVNARENLAYLCPNHHAMFDKGLVTF